MARFAWYHCILFTWSVLQSVVGTEILQPISAESVPGSNFSGFGAHCFEVLVLKFELIVCRANLLSVITDV